MIPQLPYELWQQILIPEDDYRGIAEKCLSLSLAEVLYPKNIMFDTRHVDGCFCKSSKTYRQLRLVNKVFNGIICGHIFASVTILYEKDFSFDKLEYLAKRDGLCKYVKEFDFICRQAREPGDEEVLHELMGGVNISEEGTTGPSEKRRIAQEMERLLKERVGPQILDKQANLLSLCPKVTSLCLEIGMEALAALLHPNESPRLLYFSRLANFVFRAFLRTCYHKTLAPLDHCRITDLSIEDLSEDCALDGLTASAIDQAVLGMSHIQKMSLRVIRVGRPAEQDGELQKPLDKLLGKLLRGATAMQRLTFNFLNAKPGRNCQFHLNDLIMNDDKDNLSTQQWKFLSFIDLENLGCHSISLLAFLSAHKGTLKHLHLTGCFIVDLDFENGCKDPWTTLFIEYKRSHPVEKPVYARLSSLGCGKSRHEIPEETTSELEELLGTSGADDIQSFFERQTNLFYDEDIDDDYDNDDDGSDTS